ncbi:predicted protein [Pyrenophora tritici-repentis Pt-1C-BFP]|uniref:Uncharacterized protein n=1 Tax=Pyrenophora tritici-repentis (strain Pt-1C-BFP) TaxID=426418 RepID=B2VTP8_PYRTR|nr:uncharacterized protein PTRG_00893 [Pyrenophora tritici-repentis Pt-1C-BFP]EDU40331.1 predicted protein [Pyrenophora tritici-repentis Pt-1C-BFP]
MFAGSARWKVICKRRGTMARYGTATPPNLHAAPSQGRRERGREAEMGGSGK